MMNHKKITVGILILALVLAGSGYWFFTLDNNILRRNIPITYMSGESAFDTTDPRAIVGAMDYVFVGQIINVSGTDYKYQDNTPFTNYEIRVIKNIKGELVLDTIHVQKMGGLTLDQSHYVVCEDDFLPFLGDICIFNTRAREDGTLGLYGANSNVLLDFPASQDVKKDLLTSIETSEVYHMFLTASIDPIESTLTHGVSKYDVARNTGSRSN
ncbi:MAG: hypothetical protein LBS58_00120 [Coriobacteriales bacterium]|nr:hypothetical protein [Coriobacteriales bacterium]